jgi:hypothetical protein
MTGLVISDCLLITVSEISSISAFGWVNWLDDPAARSGDIVAKRIEPKTDSVRNVNLIKSWMTGCTETHVDCLPSLSLGVPASEALKLSWDSAFPTRVVDIGPADGSKDPFVRSTAGKRGQYATLSHCWGTKNHFTTTKATLEARETGFTVESLPKTLGDAITISRHLNIRFLWIDSLCIIQDSAEDWLKEAASMADIYSNSVLTIAATGSPDSTTGCLFRQEQKEAIALTYSPSLPAESSPTLGHVYAQPTTFTYLDPIRRSPLNSRAWVFQERLLSRRTLHCAADQLYWDCNTVFLSEDEVFSTSPMQAPIPTQQKTTTPLSHSLRQLGFHGPDVPFSHPGFTWNSSILGLWLTLVPEYTRRQISVPTDYLPALAGVVSRISRRTGDTFLAGIWRSALHVELLWAAYDAPHHAPRDKDGQSIYRAPSWSWAALQGENEYPNYTDRWTAMRADMNVLEATVRWAGEECISELLGSKLVVEGSIESVRYNGEPSFNGGLGMATFSLISANCDEKRFSFDATFDQEPPPTEQVLTFLCVSRRFNRRDCWGLLLEEDNAPDGGGSISVNVYRRIGLGRIYLPAGKEELGNGRYTRLVLV